MIQLYKPGNTRYDYNGDVTLDPCTCDCTMTLNGAWNLELEVPIDQEGKFLDIVKEAVVSAPTPVSESQLFRIYDIEKSDTSVTALAFPIFYDSKDEHVLIDVRPTGKTGQQALDILCAGTKYSGRSNITKASTAYYIRKNLMEAINGDLDQSFINRWGGEILYNNYQITINERIGGDYGARAEFGYNLIGITEHVDMSGVVTRIIPVAYNGYTLEGEEPWVDSPNIGKYQKIYAKVIEFSNVKLAEDSTEGDEDACATLEELRNKLILECSKQFDAGIDLPEISYDVDIELLEGTKEYEGYEIVERIGLGDDVKCAHHTLQIETQARAVKIVYDCIKEKNKKVILGKYSETAFDSQFDTEHKVDSVINPDGSLMAERVQGILNGIYTQLRLQSTAAQKVEGRAFSIEDTDPESPLYGCMIFGTQGLQISTQRTADGRDWDWTTAITAKGIVADAIITGLLADKTGRNYWDLDTGEFRLSSDAFCVDDETIEDYINGKIDNATAQMRLLTLQLSNDMCSVATLSDGTGGDYSECYTEVTLLIGTTDITESTEAKYTVNPSSGVEGSWDLTRKRYTISGMSEDNGSVSITAVYAAIATTKIFKISKAKAGLPGEDGRTYTLQPDTLVIKQGADNAYTPETVTVSAYYRDGTTALRTPYPGRIEIEETTDGTNYYRKYLSSEDEDNHTHTPTAENVKSIRCTLYASGGTDDILDIQSVAAVRDVDNLTQEEVFNILTDDGRLQGIYMKDGMLYLNGSYIKGGQVSGEYIDARNLNVTNKTGQETFAIDADGNVNIRATTFSLSGAAVATEDYVTTQTAQTLSAAKLYANQKTRNLLKGTDLSTDELNRYWDTTGTITQKQSDPDGGTGAIRLYGTGSDCFVSANYAANNPVHNAGQYEVRVWLKSNTSRTIKISFNRVTYDCALTTTWKQYKFVCPVTTPNTQGYQNFTVGGWGSIGTGAYVYIYKPEVTHSYTPADILAMLTNNGAMQGIYMYNNQLYIKGTYIDVDDLYALNATIGGYTINSTGFYKGCTSLTSKVNGTYIGTSGIRMYYYNGDTDKESSLTFNSSSGVLDLVGISMKFKMKNFSAPAILDGSDGTITCKYGLHIYTKRAPDISDGSYDSEFVIRGIASTSGAKTVVLEPNINRVCVLSSSSKRYKNHVREMGQEAEKLLNIPVVWFEYKEGYLEKTDRFSGKPLPGFYAEDIYQEFPEAAVLDKDGSIEDWNYKTIIPPMLKLIQNLYKEIQNLKEKIK